VYLDNEYMGITPLVLSSVAPGTHTILLTHPGYAEWRATVQLQKDVRMQLDATLAPAPTPSPTKSPLPAFLSVLSLGIVVVALAFGRRI